MADFFIVPYKPSPGNDILGMKKQRDDYPVYGVVRRFGDDCVIGDVIDKYGKHLASEWYFTVDEVELIEV